MTYFYYLRLRLLLNEQIHHRNWDVSWLYDWQLHSYIVGWKFIILHLDIL